MHDLGLNRETLAKARTFAAPERGGFSDEEFEELCDDCCQGGFALSQSHAIRLLRVPEKKERRKLQLLAIKHRWTKSMLEDAILARKSRRSRGGRRLRIPGSRVQLLLQIEGLCESWARWHGAITNVDKKRPKRHGRPAELPQDKKSPKRRVRLAELPQEVQECIEKIRGDVEELQNTVHEALGGPWAKPKAAR